MMRKTLSVCSVILVIVMLAALLTACGSKIPAGTYELTEVDSGGAKFGVSGTTMTINSNGTGTSESGGNSRDIKVKSGDKIQVGDDTFSYSVKDGKLYIDDYSDLGEMTSGSSVWIFEKQE